MTNSADREQLASSETNRSGSILFAKTGPGPGLKIKLQSVYYFNGIVIC